MAYYGYYPGIAVYPVVFVLYLYAFTPGPGANPRCIMTLMLQDCCHLSLSLSLSRSVSFSKFFPVTHTLSLAPALCLSLPLARSLARSLSLSLSLPAQAAYTHGARPACGSGDSAAEGAAQDHERRHLLQGLSQACSVVAVLLEALSFSLCLYLSLSHLLPGFSQACSVVVGGA